MTGHATTCRTMTGHAMGNDTPKAIRLDAAGRTNEHAIDWMDMQIGSTTRRTEPGR